jgi:hypothetical protein
VLLKGSKEFEVTGPHTVNQASLVKLQWLEGYRAASLQSWSCTKLFPSVWTPKGVLGWRTKALMWSELSHLLATDTLHQFLSYWGTNLGAAEGQTLNAKDGGLIVCCLLHLLMYSAVFIWCELIKPNFYSYFGKGNIRFSILTDMNCSFMFLSSSAIIMTVQITLNSIYTEHNTLIIQSNLRGVFFNWYVMFIFSSKFCRCVTE